MPADVHLNRCFRHDRPERADLMDVRTQRCCHWTAIDEKRFFDLSMSSCDCGISRDSSVNARVPIQTPLPSVHCDKLLTPKHPYRQICSLLILART